MMRARKLWFKACIICMGVPSRIRLADDTRASCRCLVQTTGISGRS
jgi:hypothetical protein